MYQHRGDICTKWAVKRRLASPRYNPTSEPIRHNFREPNYKLHVEFLFDLAIFPTEPFDHNTACPLDGVGNLYEYVFIFSFRTSNSKKSQPNPQEN